MRTAGHRIGIDFGTTNSALAVSTPQGIRVAQWMLPDAEAAAAAAATSVYRSLLFFEDGADWVGGRPESKTGPEAIAHYLWTGGDGRLMQSMKSFLASHHVRATNICGSEFRLEELVALVVGDLWESSAKSLELERPETIVAGRPVTFAYSKTPDDDLYAEGRLREGFALAGFESVEFVFEPVAAAVFYEAELKHDEVVLVADFGGGTSDFCLLRVGPSFKGRATDPTRVLATAGVGVAGDAFDARIVENVVGPELGRGSRYRSLSGKTLEIPATVYKALARWHDLSLLKTPRNTQMLDGYLRNALEPTKIRALCHVVENDLGYALYRQVQDAKVALSKAERTTFRFEADEVSIETVIERADFERWISPEVARLTGGVDAVLASSNLSPAEVDTVFMTGGSALVPAVRRQFEDRFGAHKLRSGDYLTSVASGLATYAGASFEGT